MSDNSMPPDGLQWGVETNYEDVSVEEVDSLVRDYSAKRKEYEEKNKLAKEAYGECELLKGKLIALLDSAGKTNWNVDGIGRISKTKRVGARVTDKVQMLKHFKELGPEAYLSFVSVNSRTLSAYIKQETENNEKFQMPGVEATEIPNISFTRSKK